jgi:hypothetical protein
MLAAHAAGRGRLSDFRARYGAVIVPQSTITWKANAPLSTPPTIDIVRW